MEELTGYLHQLAKSDGFQFTISQITAATGVTASQLRYWERKGLIHSKQVAKNQNHTYSFMMMLRIATIAYYLKQGFTLTSAAEREQKHRQLAKVYHQFFENDLYQVVVKDNGDYELILGTVEDDPHTHAYLTLGKKRPHLHLRRV